MIKPYKNQEISKKEQVRNMFNNIAGTYDFLNHFLSLGIDKLWRKKAIKLLEPFQPKQILDVATGTGDFAIAALKLNPDHVTGVDLSSGMLENGKAKLINRGLETKISLQLGDSEHLPFTDNSFDAVTVAFGVRNFENLQRGLEEIYRVIKPGGVAVVLEFSSPKKFPIKQSYFFYFNRILPFWGRVISKDAHAYKYLFESASSFPDGTKFTDIMKTAGFEKTKIHLLSFGIASIYMGVKS